LVGIGLKLIAFIADFESGWDELSYFLQSALADENVVPQSVEVSNQV